MFFLVDPGAYKYISDVFVLVWLGFVLFVLEFLRVILNYVNYVY